MGFSPDEGVNTKYHGDIGHAVSPAMATVEAAKQWCIVTIQSDSKATGHWTIWEVADYGCNPPPTVMEFGYEPSERLKAMLCWSWHVDGTLDADHFLMVLREEGVHLEDRRLAELVEELHARLEAMTETVTA